jgi:hypothetical protein
MTSTTTTNGMTPHKGSVSVTPEVMLAYWQDERLQTRQLIEAFPEDHLFFYSLNGMKPFSELAWEVISMSIPAVTGITTGHWQPTGSFSRSWHHSMKPLNKTELLALWDKTTAEINRLWDAMPEGRLLEKQTVFGLGSGPVYTFVLRYIDQEIQYRCQAMVYLRSLQPDGLRAAS